MSLVEELIIDHHIASITPMKAFEDDRFRVRIFQGQPHEHTPNPGRYLVVEFRKELWESQFALHESKLSIMVGVLSEVVEYLGDANGPTRLRTVAIGNKRYFVDDRLMQLRNVDDPNDFVDIPRGSPFDLAD